MASSSRRRAPAGAAAVPPQLGTDVLAGVVAAVLSPDYEKPDVGEDEYDWLDDVQELRRRLRLCCKQLRDLIDEASTTCTLSVGEQDAAAPGSPLDGAAARLLGRLKSLSTVVIKVHLPDRGPYDGEDQMLDAAVVRLLLAGLPKALPGGMHRVTGLDLDADSILLRPSVAAAISGALPQLRRLDCSLPGEDEWAGQLLGSAVLYNLPTALASLRVHGGDLGPDGGAALSSLAALTELDLSVSGMGSSVCRHVAGLSGLRSLRMCKDDVCMYHDSFDLEDEYDEADVGALSSLAGLTQLDLAAPFVAEHLPLAHLTALEQLHVCTADVAAVEAVLHTPALDRLQRLDLDVYPSLSAAPEPAAAAAAAAAPGGGGQRQRQRQRQRQQQAAAGGETPLLPSLRVLGCCLSLRSPSLDRVPRLLQRLPVELSQISLTEVGKSIRDPGRVGVGRANAKQVLYPLLAPALARFTALESLSWGLAGGRDAPAGGTCADLVRAMPRLRDVEVRLGEAPGAARARQRGRAWLTDEALEAMASQPRSQVRSIILEGAADVTLEGVQGLLRLPRLRCLNVLRCPRVPDQEAWELEDEVRRRG